MPVLERCTELDRFVRGEADPERLASDLARRIFVLSDPQG